MIMLVLNLFMPF